MRITNERLVKQLKSDIYAETGNHSTSVSATIRYLMDQWWLRTPDEAERAASGVVPAEGAKPTIMQKAVDAAAHAHFGDDVVYPSVIAFLEDLGFTVIPTPPKTNAERLAEMLRSAFGSPMSIENTAKWLDANGVTAPEGGGER